MIVVIFASILLAAWHLNPRGRFSLLTYMVLFLAWIVPLTFYNRSRPGPWSMRQKIGVSAYFLAVGIVYAIINAVNRIYHMHLPDRMATWPG